MLTVDTDPYLNETNHLYRSTTGLFGHRASCVEA